VPRNVVTGASPANGHRCLRIARISNSHYGHSLSGEIRYVPLGDRDTIVNARELHVTPQTSSSET
jgi:hypothetical protein